MNDYNLLIEKYASDFNVNDCGALIFKNNNKSVHLIFISEISKHDSNEICIIKFLPLLFLQNDKPVFLLNNEGIVYDDRDNVFKLSLHHYFKTSTLSGTGKGFYIYPKFIRGFGIGTFAFYYLFKWALKNNCGYYSLNKQPIGGEDEDHILRFFLYLNTGFSLNAEAVKTQCKSGEYFASAIGNLTPHIPDKLVFSGGFEEYDNFIKSLSPIIYAYLKRNMESIFS